MEAAPHVKSRLLLNLVLLLALVGLVLYAFLRPGEEKKPEIAVTQIKREEVKSVRVQRNDGFELQLQKHDGTWLMLKPYHTRANPLEVDRLLDLTLATASGKFPAENLARYGLDPAQATVTLNNQTFEFGNINEVTNEQYLETGGQIYLVRTYLGYNLPVDTRKLLSRNLLAEAEKPVAFDFGDWKAVRNDKDAWTLRGELHPERDVAPTPDELNIWAAEWNLASALSATPFQGKPRGDRIQIELSNGNTVTFRVLSREPDVQLLRAGEDMVYQLGADAGSRLLDPYRVADAS